MTNPLAHKAIGLFLIGVVILVAGCAQPKVPFYYEAPAGVTEQAHEVSLTVSPIFDARIGLTNIDDVFTELPTTCLDRVIKQEMEGSGLFSTVEMIEHEGPFSTAEESVPETVPHKRKLTMKLELRDLAWNVPDYAQIRAISGTTGSFGLIGGVIGAAYLSTDTDVYGETVLGVQVTDMATGEIVLDKEYVGHAHEEMAKGNCDTHETKSRLVGKSVSDAMSQIKEDLKDVVTKLLEGSEKA